MVSWPELASDNLFDDILSSPARDGYDELLIISGYASAPMARRHIDILEKKHGAVPSKIRLHIGMASTDGVSRAQHRTFRELSQRQDSLQFSCSYSTNGAEVHSKLYIWLLRGDPALAWTGSANYTQTGFGLNSTGRREVLTPTDPQAALTYAEEILKSSVVDCLSPKVESSISFTDAGPHQHHRNHAASAPKHKTVGYKDAPQVTLSLLDTKTHRTPEKSGINWGQREERDSNEAYIAVPSDIQKMKFFPPRGEYFLATTDDGETLLLNSAQERGKALQTPECNSLLGRYLRKRLRISPGSYVRTSDLQKHGRSNVTFTRTGKEEYHLDFSSPANYLDKRTTLGPT